MDSFNRTSAPNPKTQTRIISYGGKEWLRRAGTKVAGVGGIGFATVDAVDGIRHGESVPHAVGRASSGLVAGTITGAGTAAFLAAAGGPPGLLIGGSLVAGTYVSDVWSRSGGSDKVGAGFERGTRTVRQGFARGDVKSVAEGLYTGAGQALGGIGDGTKAFGGQLRDDAATAGRWIGRRFHNANPFRSDVPSEALG